MTFERNVALKDLTTLQVGGPAEYFVAVRTEDELQEAVERAQADSLPFRVLAGGSNVLIPDEGLPGLTIKNEISGWAEEPYGEKLRVTVGAGNVLDEVVSRAVAKAYWGIENLSGIPGSMGATPVQNVGAYGVEVADVLESLRAFDTETKSFTTLANKDCAFGYRNSLFKQEERRRYLITSVTLQLSTAPAPQLTYKDLAEHFANVSEPSLEDIRSAVLAIRARKFPDWKTVGTAGSFFKNPIVRRVTYERLRDAYPGLPGFDVNDIEVKIPLGWVLDTVCGLRGVWHGNVGTYEGQALVLVTNGRATAREVTEFATYIEQEVFAKTGIAIEWEVTRLT